MAYRVTGAFIQVTLPGPTGEQKVALYAGAILPGDVPADEVRHHLSVNMIEEVRAGEGAVGAAEMPSAVHPLVAKTGVDQPPAPPPGNDSVPFDDPERAKAREKLAADGSAPHANAAEAVWVEYAVSRGYNFDAVRTAGKDEIRKLFA